MIPSINPETWTQIASYLSFPETVRLMQTTKKIRVDTDAVIYAAFYREQKVFDHIVMHIPVARISEWFRHPKLNATWPFDVVVRRQISLEQAPQAMENYCQMVLRAMEVDGRFDPTVNDNGLLKWAASKGITKLIRTLLEHPRVDPSVSKNYAIRIASKNGHAETVRLLMGDNRVDASADANESICSASENGHLDVVEILLADATVDPAADNNWPVRYAAKNGHLEVLKLLMDDPRVDQSACSDWALSRAARSGHVDSVKLILRDSRANPSAAFFSAIQGGHTEVVRVLIQHPRLDPSAEENKAMKLAKQTNNPHILTLLESDPRVNSS